MFVWICPGWRCLCRHFISATCAPSRARGRTFVAGRCAHGLLRAIETGAALCPSINTPTRCETLKLHRVQDHPNYFLLGFKR